MNAYRANLCRFEYDVLRAAAGLDVPGLIWGGAMGQALEVLEGHGFLSRRGGVYRLTETGEALLLVEQRVTLCDLLQGRVLRLRAAKCFEEALDHESLEGPQRHYFDEMLARAAQLEWIATISEQGLVSWGQRDNRCDGAP